MERRRTTSLSGVGLVRQEIDGITERGDMSEPRTSEQAVLQGGSTYKNCCKGCTGPVRIVGPLIRNPMPNRRRIPASIPLLSVLVLPTLTTARVSLQQGPQLAVTRQRTYIYPYRHTCMHTYISDSHTYLDTYIDT